MYFLRLNAPRPLRDPYNPHPSAEVRTYNREVNAERAEHDLGVIAARHRLVDEDLAAGPQATDPMLALSGIAGSLAQHPDFFASATVEPEPAAVVAQGVTP